MKSVYTLVGAIASAALPAYAQNISESETAPAHGQSHRPALEHVLVSMPAHKKEAKTALPIYRLDGDELQRAAAQNLGDTLAGQPGVNSASFGPAVGQPVIRGHMGPRVQVLQNSLPTLDVSSNSADHAVSVEPLLADSIEVLRGPASLLYGGGAIGGVVNIIDGAIPSRHVEGIEAAAEVRHSSVSDGRTAVSRLDAGSGQWTIHLDALYRDWGSPDIPGLAVNTRTADAEELEESSRGVLANADGRSRQHALGTAYHFSDGGEDRGYIGLSFRELTSNYGIPAGVHAEHGEHDDEEHSEEGHHDEEHHEDEHGEEGLRIDLVQLRWEAAGDLHLDGFWELLRWRWTHSDYQHVELEPHEEGESTVGTRFERKGQAARLELAHAEWGPLHGVVGVQWQNTRFSAQGDEAFVPPSEQESLGIFVAEDFHFYRWQFEVGLRADLDRLSAEGRPQQEFFGSSASVAALYDITDNWLVAASWSQSRRAATAEERYSNIAAPAGELVVHGATGVIEVGDQDLGHETSDNYEVKLQLSYPRVSGDVTAYYNDFANYIYLQHTEEVQEETSIYRYRQNDATFHGVEYQFDWLLTDGGDAGQFSLGVFGDRINASLNDGEWLPRLPPRSDGLRLAFSRKLAKGLLTADTSWVRVNAQRRQPLNESATAGYHRVDASVAWSSQFGDTDYTLFVKGRNLGNEEIRNSTSFIRDVAPEPGRNIELGMRVNFGS